MHFCLKTGQTIAIAVFTGLVVFSYYYFFHVSKELLLHKSVLSAIFPYAHFGPQQVGNIG